MKTCPISQCFNCVSLLFEVLLFFSCVLCVRFTYFILLLELCCWSILSCHSWLVGLYTSDGCYLLSTCVLDPVPDSRLLLLFCIPEQVSHFCRLSVWGVFIYSFLTSFKEVHITSQTMS